MCCSDIWNALADMGRVCAQLMAMNVVPRLVLDDA